MIINDRAEGTPEDGPGPGPWPAPQRPPVFGTYRVLIALAVVVAVIAAFVPSIAKVRHADERTRATGQLKQLAVAMWSSPDGLLPRDIAGKDGRPLLSWRVAVLPYLEQDHLYRQFKLDEPWDGPANKKLLKHMPKTFADPRFPKTPAGFTHYQGFSGPGTPFGPAGEPRKFDTLADLASVIAVVETAAPVEWTRPGGIPADGPLPPLGDGEVALAAMLDSATLTLTLPPDLSAYRLTVPAGEKP